MGEPFWSCKFFFINLPLKLFNFNFMFFFPKKLFWFWILKRKIWLDRRKKYILTWHFHSIIIYKIRSTHLLPILDLIIPPLPEGGEGILFYLCPSVLPKYFSSHFSQQLLMAEIWYLVTSFTSVCHIVGSVFGTIRFLLPVCRLSWFLSTLNIYMHIFLNNYWWQKSGIWSQASYRYLISWEVAGVS